MKEKNERIVICKKVPNETFKLFKSKCALKGIRTEDGALEAITEWANKKEAK